MNNYNNRKKESKFKKMFKKLHPTYIYNKVEDIPYFVFDKYNIELVMFDMDNTLIDGYIKYNEELKKWVKGLKKKGIKLYILSNSISKNTVKDIAHKLGMQYYLGAMKPSTRGFKYILDKENVNKQNAFMIGDQIFTDVWGGNRFGIKTILVKPIGKKESIITKVKRPLEKLILKNIEKENKGGK